MKCIALIPARYASTRFPGKPLADMDGKSMIQRVYEQAALAVEEVCVATDDVRIYDAVTAFGGCVVMTSTAHQSGTDRCYEAFTALGSSADVIINVQGDEPFIHPQQIDLLKECFTHPATDIATLIKPFLPEDGSAALFNVNTPKVVIDNQGKALYFSRSVIPHLRNIAPEAWLNHHVYYKHIGMYAYRKEVLAQITTLSPSSLEQAESLEQLRWLQHGYTIKTAVTHRETIGIDTPDDLERALAYLRAQPL